MRSLIIFTILLFGGFVLFNWCDSCMAKADEADSVAALSKDVIQREYNRSCIACHGSGAAGAPRTHDVVTWETRLTKGMPVLVKNTRDGYLGMPPAGFCPNCSDEVFEALILYMATE